MTEITLDLLKTHVRADDYTDDDAKLAVYLRAAEGWVLGQINSTMDEVRADNGGEIPDELAMCILDVAGAYLAEPEAETTASLRLKPTVVATLRRYRKFRRL